MRIKVNDQVQVISGDDKGMRGTVVRVDKKNGRVVVSGVNMVTKHQKPSSGGRNMSQTQGGIIKFEAAISASNVMLVCPDTGEPTRVGVRREKGDDGKSRRIRYSIRSGKDID